MQCGRDLVPWIVRRHADELFSWRVQITYAAHQIKRESAIMMEHAARLMSLAIAMKGIIAEIWMSAGSRPEALGLGGMERGVVMRKGGTTARIT